MSPWYGPKCWYKGSPVLVDGDGVKSNFDVPAKPGVMKSKRHKREVSRQGSESETRRDAIRANRIPHADTFDQSRNVESSTFRRQTIFGNSPLLC